MFGGTTNVLGSKLGWADTGASTIGPSLPVVSTDDNFSIYSVAGLEAYYSTKDPADITTATGVQLWRDRSGKSNANCLTCDGVYGNDATTPNAAANQIVNDIDIRIRLSLPSWTPAGGVDKTLISKWSTAPNLGWAFNFPTAGTPNFYFTSDGTTVVAANATAAVSFAAYEIGWLRVTRTKADGVVTFYTSTDGASWTQLGATVVAAAGSGIANVNSSLKICGISNGSNAGHAGQYYYADIRASVGGAIAQVFDLSSQARLATSFVSSTGETWTINATGATGARISGARDLYQGTAASQLTNLPWSGTNYGWLPGVAGNYFSTPDSAAVSITGDIDLRVCVALKDWTPSAKQALIGKTNGINQFSYFLWINAAGTVTFQYAATGPDFRPASSSVATGFADGSIHWIRSTYASATGKVNFYTSSDGISWSALGAEQTITAGAILDSTAKVEIGSESNGLDFPSAGSFYRAQIYNGIGGTLVADFNPAEAADGASSWVSSTGETWTVNTSGGLPATIVGRPGVLADGVNDYLKTAPFPLVQPEWVVLVGRQVSWTSGDCIIDGFNVNGMLLVQYSSTPNLALYAGSYGADNANLAVGITGILTGIFDGASSKFQINRGTAATGSIGTSAAGGLTLAAGATPGSYANIVVNELAIFSRAPSAVEIDRVVRYMARKWQIAT